jgi:hypothetical protein
LDTLPAWQQFEDSVCLILIFLVLIFTKKKIEVSFALKTQVDVTLNFIELVIVDDPEAQRKSLESNCDILSDRIHNSLKSFSEQLPEDAQKVFFFASFICKKKPAIYYNIFNLRATSRNEELTSSSFNLPTFFLTFPIRISKKMFLDCVRMLYLDYVSV